MNKNFLYTGLIILTTGIILLIVNRYTNFEGILSGMGISLSLVGSIEIFKYIYWSRPGNMEKYKEKLKKERIEQHDEFKNKVRGLAIRYTFIIELIILSVSIVGFALLGQLGYITESRIIVLYLGAFLLAQLIISYVIYYHLLNKYLQ